MQRRPTILIVDDLVSTRELIRDLLGGEGYELLTAAGGAEALEIARTRDPDLVLLDLMMPDIDGLQVCRRLRADARTVHLPVIIITALEDQRARVAGLEAGCDDFLSKPVDMIELRARVRTVVTLNRYRTLLDEQRRFERLFEISPHGLLIVDAGGAIELANPAMAALVGAPTPADLRGLTLAQLLAPDERPRFEAWLAEVVQSQLSAAHLAAHLGRRDHRHLDHRRRPVELDAGWFTWAGASAVQVAVRDISDRKRAELLEEDNRRFAFDLHDAVAQTATAAYRQLERFRHRHRPRRPEARAELDRALDLLQRLMRETRSLLAGLRPTALDDFGLAGALRMHLAALAAEGLSVELDEQIGPARFDAAVEMALFRIAQEALTNVRKHAGGAAARLTLSAQDGCLRLSVADSGPGMAACAGPAPAGTRLGVRGMHERAALLGGRLLIESEPGRGTSVLAEIPVAPDQEHPDA